MKYVIGFVGGAFAVMFLNASANHQTPAAVQLCAQHGGVRDYESWRAGPWVAFCKDGTAWVVR